MATKTVEQLTTDTEAVLATAGVTIQDISNLHKLIADLNNALQYQDMLTQLEELVAKAQTVLGVVA